MKKHLLVTGMIFCSFALCAQEPSAGEPAYVDSVAVVAVPLVTKAVPVLNPRSGFKDLFEPSFSSAGANFRLNPMAVSFVQDYIGANSNKLAKMKSWGKPYFDMMDNILGRYGLPEELKYLSVIESDLKSYAVSWAGAVGPWQFMPATARAMGLRVSRSGDERTDFYKSTHAAARYLTYLYSLYNDWLLVIAAYNGGPGAVNSAIRRSGSRNFWTLQGHLPAESRTHVKKFIATHYIMEGSGGMTTLTKSERAEHLLQHAQPVSSESSEGMVITGRYNSMAIAQTIGLSMAEFHQLNPAFDKRLAATGSYHLQLPPDKLLVFKAMKPQILEQSLKLILASTTSPTFRSF